MQRKNTQNRKLTKCSFCGRLDKNYAGFCQNCYTYFVRNQFKTYPKPKYGEIGIVDKKSDNQYNMRICHICGRAYEKLQSHIYYIHHLSKNEYCDQFGIDRKARLTTDNYNLKMKLYAYKYNMDEQVSKAGAKTRFEKGHNMNYTRSQMTLNRLKRQRSKDSERII